MNLNELKEALKEREFEVLKGVRIKKRNKEMLDFLAKNGIDVGAVIDLALEKIKLEKIVKDIEKSKKKSDENVSENSQNLAQKNDENLAKNNAENANSFSQNFSRN
jgi:arsenate reductase-like glutaredoxin family protein